MEPIFHKGELEIQERTGEAKMASNVKRMVKNKIIRGAIPFLENQSFVIISSLDSNNKVWTSLLLGYSGWINASTEGKLAFSLGKIISPKSDIFFKNIKENNQVGLLFIELGTRRRYRVNGRVGQNGDDLEITIQEAYPNCPKYIQRRVLTSLNKNRTPTPQTSEGTGLNALQKEWIKKSDTFFVGSQSKAGYLDASHRGGQVGFIEILADGTLKIPDYTGNSLYNTLGNMVEEPNAGLVFIDFEKGNTLQLTGNTTLLFDQFSEKDKLKTGDTGRYWLFKPAAWIQTKAHHEIIWEYLDSSPFNPNA